MLFSQLPVRRYLHQELVHRFLLAFFLASAALSKRIVYTTAFAFRRTEIDIIVSLDIETLHLRFCLHISFKNLKFKLLVGQPPCFKLTNYFFY